MSIYYTVRPCDTGDFPLFDRDEEEDDISYFIDQLSIGPRTNRPQNGTVTVRVCKKSRTDNNTQSAVINGQNSGNGTGAAGRDCKLKNVTVSSLVEGKVTKMSEEGIPKNILEEIERDLKGSVNETEPYEAKGDRQRRQAEDSMTDRDISSGETTLAPGWEALENGNDTGVEIKVKQTNGTKEESNEILLDSPGMKEKTSAGRQSNLQDVDVNILPQTLIRSDPEQQTVDLLGLEYNHTAADVNGTGIDLIEYDDYSQEVLLL